MQAQALRQSTRPHYSVYRPSRSVSQLWTPNDPEYYPSSDGEPMAENTIHFLWIVTIHEALCVLYMEEADVFIASDLLWYPVKGKVKLRRAPDCMVVFGRPKRKSVMIPSYLQWDEENIPPHVVIEVRSQSDTTKVLDEKFNFYQEHGVEEYLLIDPATKSAQAWLRKGDRLVKVTKMEGWQSPRTGLRFEKGGDFNILLPNGSPMVEPAKATHEAEMRWKKEQQLREEEQTLRLHAQAKYEAEHKEKEALRSEKEALRSEKEALRSENEALIAKLRQLGIDPNTL